MPSEDKFDLSDPESLFRSLFVTLARYQREGLQPGAELWSADTRWGRPKLVNDVRDEWLTAVGKNELFPWHDDYIIYCWGALRRASSHTKRELCDFFGIETPKKWTNQEELSAT